MFISVLVQDSLEQYWYRMEIYIKVYKMGKHRLYITVGYYYYYY